MSLEVVIGIGNQGRLMEEERKQGSEVLVVGQLKITVGRAKLMSCIQVDPYYKQINTYISVPSPPCPPSPFFGLFKGWAFSRSGFSKVTAGRAKLMSCIQADP